MNESDELSLSPLEESHRKLTIELAHERARADAAQRDALEQAEKMADFYLAAETKYSIEREQLLAALRDGAPALVAARALQDETKARLEAAEQRVDALQSMYHDGLNAVVPDFERTRVAFEQTQLALHAAEQQLYALQALHEDVVRSLSWRLTKPLRALDRLRRGNRRDFADGFWRQLNGYMERSAHAKKSLRRRLLLMLLNLTHPLLRYSEDYRNWRGAAAVTAPPQLVGDSIDVGRIAHETRALSLATSDTPLLSIVIAAYGNLPMTLGAVKSIAIYPPVVPFEVIVAEDASGDADIKLLAQVEGLRFFENQANLGFLRSSNAAAKMARGQYIFLMNNDAEVTPGALDTLMRVFEEHSDAGLVGSKLVYPDGRLQEAGGVIWRDGSGLNYGRLDDPGAAPYGYLREVDYCSGAAIMLTRDMFQALGGFDEHFLPAYYEDTDLAFRVRDRGKKVYYQPLSMVVHREGASHGTDIEVGIKAHQQTNQKKFRERWQTVLEREHASSGQDLFHASARSFKRKTVLVVDRFIPQPDRDAGSRSTLHFLDALLALGYTVKFWPHDLKRDAQYVGLLQNRGIEVFYDRDRMLSFEHWYQENCAHIDAVLLSRPNIAVSYVATLRRHGNALVAFYGHDIHYLRLAGELEREPDNRFVKRALDFFLMLEPQLWKQMDVIYYPSSTETEMVRSRLKSVAANVAVRTVPVFAYADFPEIVRSPSARAGLLFVGSFAHIPNIDGVVWFMEQVLPLIQRRHPLIDVYLVGSNPGERIKGLAGAHVKVTGFVTDDELEAVYRSARVAIAPLRYGAGMKGKVAEALRFGLPMVTTSAGIQGFEAWREVMACADDAEGFADAVLALLEHEPLWLQRSAAAERYARSNLSIDALKQILALDLPASNMALSA